MGEADENRYREWGPTMARFVALANWTDQGIRGFRDTVDRAAAFEALVRQHGGTLERMLWTIGPYDMVAVMEFPNDEEATAAALALGSAGNVRTTTLRAFDQAEMAKIVERAG